MEMVYVLLDHPWLTIVWSETESLIFILCEYTICKIYHVALTTTLFSVDTVTEEGGHLLFSQLVKSEEAQKQQEASRKEAVLSTEVVTLKQITQSWS